MSDDDKTFVNSSKQSDRVLGVRIAVLAFYLLGIPAVAAFWPVNWARGLGWFALLTTGLFLASLAKVLVELRGIDRLVFRADMVSLEWRGMEQLYHRHEVVVRRRWIVQLLQMRGVFLAVPNRRSMLFVPETMVSAPRLRQLLGDQAEEPASLE